MIPLTKGEFEQVKKYYDYSDYILEVRKQSNLTLAEIDKAVREEFLLPEDWRLETTHETKFRIPRQLAHWLGFKSTKLPYEKIASYFGGKDRSTIYHSVKKIEEYIENKDREYFDSIQNVRKSLSSG